MTDEEKEDFHLSMLKLKYEEAEREYILRSNTRLGKLISNRELQILREAKRILNESRIVSRETKE